KDNGALIRVNDAGREFRQIRAFNNRTFDVDKALPTVVMSNEDYGRISRILADRSDVVLEFNIVNRVYPEGTTSYNTIAEIPGTDKADEVIMLGGPGFLARCDWRYGQRNRLRDNDGGSSNPEDVGCAPPAHDPRCALEW